MMAFTLYGLTSTPGCQTGDYLFIGVALFVFAVLIINFVLVCFVERLETNTEKKMKMKEDFVFEIVSARFLSFCLSSLFFSLFLCFRLIFCLYLFLHISFLLLYCFGSLLTYTVFKVFLLTLKNHTFRYIQYQWV